MRRIHPLRLEKIKMPVIFGGAAVVIFILLSIRVAIEGNGSSHSGSVTTENVSIETRLENLENKMLLLEEIGQRLSRIEQRDQTITDFIHRLESLEASIPTRFDELTRQLENTGTSNAKTIEKTDKRASGKPAIRPKTVKTKKARVEKTVEKEKKKPVRKIKRLYHVVQTKETLFGISQKYGLQVSQLRKMNNLKVDDPIHPGQKLLVKQGK
jgi:LysM repeat protein